MTIIEMISDPTTIGPAVGGTLVGLDTTVATQRFFAGLGGAVAVHAPATEPSADTNTVYFGCDSTEANLAICSNDNAGSATCTTLGADFPCRTNGAVYNLQLWAAPNASAVSYAIERLDVAKYATGTVSSDLPQNTVALDSEIWAGNAGTASSTFVSFGQMCVRANW